MKLFKSIFNGVGTGAGVAWPLFGISFSIMGASIGGLVSITLGGIAIGLFSVIGLAVAYLSYKKMNEEQQTIQTLLSKNEKKLITRMNDYMDIIHKEYQLLDKSTNFSTYLNLKFKKFLSNFAKEEQILLTQVLNYLHENEQSSLYCASIPEHIKRQVKPHYSVPFAKLSVAAFYGFVGTFGSIAGCSAGVAGLLTGLGLFSSFTAFPILGWSILAIAFFVALYAAKVAYNEAEEEYKNDLWSQTVKKTSNEIKEHNHHLMCSLFQNTPPKVDKVTNKCLFIFSYKRNENRQAVKSGLEFFCGGFNPRLKFK